MPEERLNGKSFSLLVTVTPAVTLGSVIGQIVDGGKDGVREFFQV